MKRYAFMVAIGAVALGVCGCGKDAEGIQKNDSKDSGSISNAVKKVARASRGAFYTQLKAGDVLMRVGTNELTKADVEKLVDLRMKVISLGLTEEQKKLALNRSALWVPIVMALPENFQREVALLDWAATNGVTLGKADVAEYRTGFLRGCNAEKEDYATFMWKNFTADERRVAEHRIRIEATCAKIFKEHCKKNPVKFKPEEVDAFVGRVMKYNAMAEATNVLVWARASNVWERVKGGADFKNLAKAFTEDVSAQDEGGEWGIYTLGELEKEEEGELAQLLSSMKVGDTAPPVESDNGVAVVRIDNITDEYGVPIPAGKRPFGAHYELSRIYFQLAQTYEIPSKGECEKEVQQYLEANSFKVFVEGLINGVTVEYPCGRKVFEDAAMRSQMPQMLMQEGVTNETLEKTRKQKAK